MNYIKSRSTDGTEVKIHYQDIGKGTPVVLIHGWPLDHQMWEYQTLALSSAGYRCITYDRRGFGKSDKPLAGYDYDTLTDDLKALLEELDLQDAILVGFSMGGGEVVRYFSKYGGNRISKIVLLASIAPYLLKTDDNPDGVPEEMIQEIASSIQEDRAGFLGKFGKQFYGVGILNHPVSQERLDWNLIVALQASLPATLACAEAFSTTDLRVEMSAINVPALVIHGDKDETVPIDATGKQAASMIKGAQYVVYEGEPHGLFFTAKDRLNNDLLRFFAGEDLDKGIN